MHAAIVPPPPPQSPPPLVSDGEGHKEGGGGGADTHLSLSKPFPFSSFQWLSFYLLYFSEGVENLSSLVFPFISGKPFLFLISPSLLFPSSHPTPLPPYGGTMALGTICILEDRVERYLRISAECRRGM